jgi:hypothetical protein
LNGDVILSILLIDDCKDDRWWLVAEGIYMIQANKSTEKADFDG